MYLLNYSKILCLIAFFLLAGCSGSGSDGETAQSPVAEEQPVSAPEPDLGFELFELKSNNEIIVWISSELTEEQFNAIELPDGWFKNEPRESDVDSGVFLRSPDAVVDGPLLEEELFGHVWKQNAVIVETNIMVDGQSLLTGSYISKFHHVTFNANKTLSLLISPQGEQYVRISRDANRESEIPTVPDTWQSGEYVTPNVLDFTLPNPTLNIRLDNEDSFQGPIESLPVEQITSLAFGTGTSAPVDEPPIELTTALCDDPSNLALIVDSLSGAFASPSYGDVNPEQFQKLLAEPTAGPFYMINLIRFREQAVYADGRETDLTGRKANALYSPTEFLNAIGARTIFVADVNKTLAGGNNDWDQVGIVQYPCPLAFMAMSVHPEFQARTIHKDAGLEASTVMPGYLEELPEIAPLESPFPSSEADPSFELVQVLHYNPSAMYPDGSEQPERTGQDAMNLYAAEILDAQASLGIVPKMRFQIDGVIIGDGRQWDSVWVDYVPSQAALDALNTEPTVAAAQIHRDAAISSEYSLATEPLLSLTANPFGKGSRYCEILLATAGTNGFTAEVWGTQGLNDCPQSSLDVLDLDTIANENGALLASLNGPRIWVVNEVSNQSRGLELKTFGGLLMARLATVELEPSELGQPEILAYVESTVLRSTTYIYNQGESVFELISPEGGVYVMQSISLMRNPDLTLDNLPILGGLLTLPDGWRYQERMLTDDRVLTVDGQATIITDDLGNTYQKM